MDSPRLLKPGLQHAVHRASHYPRHLVNGLPRDKVPVRDDVARDRRKCAACYAFSISGTPDCAYTVAPPSRRPLLPPAAMAYRPGNAQTERTSSDTLLSSNASSPLRELMERADQDDEYSSAPWADSKGQAEEADSDSES
eukprot:1394473-Pleurochrysis_carterae.AAC.1